MNSKVMFIMRGLPGSGKSTVAQQIKRVYGDLAVVCSVDDFSPKEQGENYAWKAEECEAAHMMCQEKAKQACQHGIPVVVIGACLYHDHIQMNPVVDQGALGEGWEQGWWGIVENVFKMFLTLQALYS